MTAPAYEARIAELEARHAQQIKDANAAIMRLQKELDAKIDWR